MDLNLKTYEDVAHFHLNNGISKKCNFSWLPTKVFNGKYIWMTSYFQVSSRNEYSGPSVFVGNFTFDQWLDVQNIYFSALGKFNRSSEPSPSIVSKKDNVTFVDFKRKR